MGATLAGLVAKVWSRRRAASVLVGAEPDVALLSTAAALRRLGARITRYDGEVGTLEARMPGSAARVRVRVAPEAPEATRVHLEGDPGARQVIRRFRRALSA